MFCPKCGKKIVDDAAFCEYCGAPVEVEIPEQGESRECEEARDREICKVNAGLEEGDALIEKPKKSWIIPVCVVVVTIMLVVIGGVVMTLVKNRPKETPAVEKVLPEEEKVVEANYPREILLDAGVESKVSELIHLLGNADCKLDGLDGEKKHEGYSVLYMSLYTDVPFVNGKIAERVDDGTYLWKIPEDVVVSYLKNTINHTEYFEDSQDLTLIDGMVYVAPHDPRSMWTVDMPKIDTVTAISENEMKVEGTVHYGDFEGRVEDVEFSIILKSNPESIWGGYTLTDIESWETIGETSNNQEVLEAAFGGYLIFLTDAINTGDYTNAECFMSKGSSLYEDQLNLVQNLRSQGITEELRDWDILDVEYLDETHAKILSDEVIDVTYGDGSVKTLYQNYYYTCEWSGTSWLFTSISES